MFAVRSSGYKMGCTVAAVSAQRSVEHAKNALQNITTEWMMFTSTLSSIQNLINVTVNKWMPQWPHSRHKNQCPFSQDQLLHSSNLQHTAQTKRHNDSFYERQARAQGTSFGDISRAGRSMVNGA